MKIYLLIGSLLILFLQNQDIASFRCSLQALKNILSNNHYLSEKEEKEIKAKVKSLINYIVYYEITDNMLKQFKSISPELFNEMDTLRNCKGKIIDVYVKFIPKSEAQFEGGAGMASFEQDANDFNSCNSEYGEGSVSIKIWTGYNTLCVLSHEFGHVRYLVPNVKRMWNITKRNTERHFPPLGWVIALTIRAEKPHWCLNSGFARVAPDI